MVSQRFTHKDLNGFRFVTMNFFNKSWGNLK